MKSKICLIALLFAGFSFAKTIIEHDQRLYHAFVPNGFDANDTVEVVVATQLPTSCYKIGMVSTEIDSDTKTLWVHVRSYQFTGKCIKYPVSVFQTVRVGLVWQPGMYKVRDRTSGATIGSLNVTEEQDPPSHGTDSVAYAPLTDAYLLNYYSKPSVILTGAFTNSCLGFKEVKMTPQADVLVVQPIIAKVQETGCRAGNFRFHKGFPIKVQIPSSTFLLHVRSISGVGINKIVLGQ